MELKYKKLKPEVKQAWLEALRSGEYCQTKGQLVDEHGYCCLGVLAEELGDPKGWVCGGTYQGDQSWRYKGLIATLAVDELGLCERASGVLIAMNDAGDSFQTIADWIEDNL